MHKLFITFKKLLITKGFKMFLAEHLTLFLSFIKTNLMFSLIVILSFFGIPTFAQPKENLKEIAFFNLKAVKYCYKKCSVNKERYFDKEQNRIMFKTDCQDRCLSQGLPLIKFLENQKS